MTSIIGSLSNYAHKFDPQELKKKAVDLASRFFTIYTYPNEPRQTAILRIVCEKLADIAMTFALVTGGIPLAIGFLAYRAFEPADHFIIENAGGSITNEELQPHLRKLLEIQKQFDCIEVRSAQPIALNDENAKILKQLHANKLILPISNDLIVLDHLASFSHYYKDEPYSNPDKSIYHFVRKEMIQHVVLPTNTDEMVTILTKLVEQNERVNKLYFTTIVPQKREEEVADLLEKIKPSLKLFVNNLENHSTKTLEAMLHNA